MTKKRTNSFVIKPAVLRGLVEPLVGEAIDRKREETYDREKKNSPCEWNVCVWNDFIRGAKTISLRAPVNRANNSPLSYLTP